MSANGTVTCSWCYEAGHNRRTCRSHKDHVVKNPNSWTARYQKEKERYYKKRTCSYCDTQGHNRRTCPFFSSDQCFIVETIRAARAILYTILRGVGFGRGALIREDCWGNLCLVRKIDWKGIDHRHLKSHEIYFHATRCDTGRMYAFALTLEQLGTRVLSPAPARLIEMPNGWVDGTLYDTHRWFGNKSRHHYFCENNSFCP